MRTYAILVTNTWTGKRTLMPGTYDELMGNKTIKVLKAKCSHTGPIPNNSYQIVEIIEQDFGMQQSFEALKKISEGLDEYEKDKNKERGCGDDYPVIEPQNWK